MIAFPGDLRLVGRMESRNGIGGQKRIGRQSRATGRARWRRMGVDSCIVSHVANLNALGIPTVGACCGHGLSGAAVIDLRRGHRLTVQP